MVISSQFRPRHHEGRERCTVVTKLPPMRFHNLSDLWRSHVYPIKTLATAGLVMILGSATGMSLYSVSHERRQTAELAATNQSLTATIAKMESQLDEVSRKLAEVQNQQTAPVLPEPVRSTVRIPRPVATRPADDSRLDQLRARINEQEQEIAGTKDQLQQTRADLRGRLDSTRDELNGSIARTHDD